MKILIAAAIENKLSSDYVKFLKNKKTVDAIETAKFITRAVTAKKEDEINENSNDS